MAPDLQAVGDLRARFDAFLGAAAVDAQVRQDWLLVFNEALVNAIRHGGAKTGAAMLVVTWAHEPGAISLCIEDPGDGFARERLESAELPDDGDEGGRGLFILQAFADSVHTMRGSRGFAVTLRKAHTGPAPLPPAEAELEQVLIDAFDLLEDASNPDRFRYRIRLREYTEPPEPPAFPDFDLGADLLPDIGLDIDLGLDLLDLPGLVGAVPDIDDLLSPVEGAAEGLKETMAGAPALLTPLADLLGGGS